MNKEIMGFWKEIETDRGMPIFQDQTQSHWFFEVRGVPFMRDLRDLLETRVTNYHSFDTDEKVTMDKIIRGLRQGAQEVSAVYTGGHAPSAPSVPSEVDQVRAVLR